jgi:hypothetical protein
MKVLAIILLVFAVYFNVLLVYRLFSDKNDKININAVITSVNGIAITYSYSYNGKTYTRDDVSDKNLKVGDLYPITIDKNGELYNTVSGVISNIFGEYILTILLFLSVLFYGLSYYVNRD